MKILQKLLILALSVATLTISLFACNNGEDGEVKGEVSDKEWSLALDLNFDAAESVTFIIDDAPTYERSQAKEYGKYDVYKSIYKIDIKNNVAIDETTDVEYDKEKDTFITKTRTTYMFKQNEKYYEVTFKTETDKEDEWTSREVTKADFTETMELMVNSSSHFELMSLYKTPEMKKLFTYDEESKSYKIMSMGTMSYNIQFLDNGYCYWMDLTSLTRVKYSVKDFNTTTVEIPAIAIEQIDK